jgi:hypothetical protein
VKKLKKKQAIKQLQEVKLEENYEEYIDKYKHLKRKSKMLINSKESKTLELLEAFSNKPEVKFLLTKLN